MVCRRSAENNCICALTIFLLLDFSLVLALDAATTENSKVSERNYFWSGKRKWNEEKFREKNIFNIKKKLLRLMDYSPSTAWGKIIWFIEKLRKKVRSLTSWKVHIFLIYCNDSVGSTNCQFQYSRLVQSGFAANIAFAALGELFCSQ